MNEWCSLESDPGLLTELMETLGIPELQAEEMHCLEEDVIEDLRHLYGLIFLLKFPFKEERVSCSLEGVYFSQQVVPGACATQAVLNVVLNHEDIKVSREIQEFKSQTISMTPEVRGLALSNQSYFRNVHNSYSRPEALLELKQDQRRAASHHFIAFIPIKGRLYELDALKGPIYLGECREGRTRLLANHLKQRIDKFHQKEVHFNLMAIIKKKKIVYEEEISNLREKRMVVQKKLDMVNNPESDEYARLVEELQEITDQAENYSGLIAGEEALFATWQAENIRRRHNYIPFLFNFVRVLAEKDLLVPLVERAKEKQKQRIEKK
eukprot:TRINITY_DN6852_c0_g2_i20.p1 TRINITY_DN6852_c0_g2~~TRINITY_DN6852_c0_g2_i20.p1  ORF type:complete len:324 (-),score=67.64 TRINITY_DN6852_c0_g2_i20:292-1263(-)